jgi:hypothetical protein
MPALSVDHLSHRFATRQAPGFFYVLAGLIAATMVAFMLLSVLPSLMPAPPAFTAAGVEAQVGSASKTSAALESVHAAGGIVRVQPETWDDASRGALEQALSLLPASVRAELGNANLGPLYVLVNEQGATLSGRRPYGRAANFYSTSDGRNEIVVYPGQTPRTLLHELGHAYNLRAVPAGSYARVFLEPEMQSFLAVAGWRVRTPPETLQTLSDHTQVEYVYEGRWLWTELSRDDPLEDFASSFALYFSAPRELQRLSPERYRWFDARFDSER